MDGAAAASSPTDALEPSGLLRSDLWIDRADAGEDIDRRRRGGELTELEAAALADLRQRTGLNVTSVEVRRIDLLRDTADLQITYSD